MNRAARREQVFLDDECCSFFLHLLSGLPARDGTRVHGYALMPNHFHLLLTAGRGGLGPALKHLQSHYGRWLNETHGWDGPMWRSRFKSRRVDSEDYWRHLLAYVHRNPVRAGLAASTDDARWTSHAAYLTPEEAPKWLTTEEHLEIYGDVEGYRGYLKDLDLGVDVAPEGIDPDRLWQSDKRVQPLAIERPPPQVRSPGRWPMAEGEAWAALSMITGRSREEILEEGPGSRGAVDWWLTLWWLPRARGQPDARIAAELGIHPAAITRARKRLSQRCVEDGLLARRMARLGELLPK